MAKLTKSGSLSGTVVDARGEPVAGAVVSMNPSLAEINTASLGPTAAVGTSAAIMTATASAADGTFSFPDLPAVDYGDNWEILKRTVAALNAGGTSDDWEPPSSSTVQSIDVRDGSWQMSLANPPCITVAAPSFARVYVPYYRVPSELTVTLREPAAVIEGTVVDADSGQPLAGIGVTAQGGRWGAIGGPI